VAAKNYPIGKFEVEVPPLPVGKADVLVTMELQPTGKLNVTAKSSKANEQREYKVREITNKFVVN
jgi:molecular chaperone DnaK (HSP70)